VTYRKPRAILRIFSTHCFYLKIGVYAIFMNVSFLKHDAK